MINEADTCRRYVLPKLYEAGWNNDQISEQMAYAEILDLRFAYSTNGHGIVEHDFITGKQRELSGFPKPDELWTRLKGSVVPEDEKAAAVLVAPFNRELRNPDGSVKLPRYFQIIAVNRAVAAVLAGRRRILLTMATGTGKSFVAAQVIWKLWKSGRKRRILYIADRNILIDQPLAREFSMFGDAVWKIQGEAKKGREIYFALYQAISEDESRPGLYRQYPRDYFDLIVVDECHRGSAKDESRWREILEYFEPATQIGMTATPKHDVNVDTYSYFGAPVYTYSLARGIDDGFLAPYRVHRVVTSLDATGYRPAPGELDLQGKPIPDGTYGTKDFEKTLSVLTRTKAVAHHLTNYLKKTSRFDKTIVFCVDQEHAAQMRQALHNDSPDLTREYPHYVARVTADEGKEGRKHLDDFQDPEKLTPVILTTSQLLTTGVDVPDLRNVVIFKTIESIVEFKQVIGRGTRLYPDKEKLFFTILDYTGATQLFADPDFDGEPEIAEEEEIDETGETTRESSSTVKESDEDDTGTTFPPPPGAGRKLYVDGVPVEISVEAVWQLDANGRRISVSSYAEFTGEQVRKIASGANDLRSRWATEEGRQGVIEAMAERGIAVEELAEALGPEADPLDLLVHVAWNAPLRTRRERAEGLLRGNQRFFEKYSPQALEFVNGELLPYLRNLSGTGRGDTRDVIVIVTNPPFGGEEEKGIQENFPTATQTSETALLFLQFIMRSLKAGGRCGMVVPNGVLFGDGVAVRVKKDLVENLNLHTIVRLPNGVFAPYASIPTNLLFFEKTHPTKEIWFYEQPLPEGRKNHTKTMPMRFEEFASCQAWWGGPERKGRVENDRAWRVSVDQIVDSNYNLDLKNPNRRDDFAHLPPEQLVEDIIAKEKRILKIMGEIKELIARPPA